MNILRILLFLFGTTSIAYSNDLEIVRRRVQSSMNYGSANQNNYQSGIESKKGSMSYGSQNTGSTAIKKQSHNSIQHGSMKYSSQKHGSYAIKGHGSQRHSSQVHGSQRHGSQGHGSQGHGSQRHGSQRHGSTALHKGSHKYNSGSHGGSNKKYMSAYVFSATNYGSNNNNYCTKTKGSGTKGSAPHSSYIYNAFAPTLTPTEQLPPIYTPPPPTYFPTSYMNMPKIPISFEKNDDITIPPLSLSFQIKQGGNGWSSYPDPPTVLTSAVSAVTGLNKKYIKDMRVSSQSNRRKLSSQFYFYYNITLPIQDANLDKNNQEKIYTAIVYILQYSVVSGAFTNYFKNISLPINITSMAASPYIIVYSAKPVVQSTTIESTNNKSDPTLIYFYIVFGTLVLVAGASTIAYFVYKKRNMKNNTINIRDSIPNPMQKQIQLVAN